MGMKAAFLRNVVFWHWIEQQTLSEYQKAVKDLNDPSVHEAYAMENHRLSKELKRKILYMRGSVLGLIIGLVFAALSTGLSFLAK